MIHRYYKKSENHYGVLLGRVEAEILLPAY
jgi:hypothetical protein